jgi:peptide chain release factor 2
MTITDKQLEIVQARARALVASLTDEAWAEKIAALEKKTLVDNFWQDPQAREVMQTLGQLQEEQQTRQLLLDLLSEFETAEFLLQEDSENQEYLKSRAQVITKLQKEVQRVELEKYLAGKYDRLDAILSVHAGQGGVEAMDWANMLARAYTRYFERKGWRFTIINESRGEEAGIKAVSYEVKGKFAYGLLKNEAGTHRLVRLSPFNSDNLRQTSFALVEVLPLLEETDKNIVVAEADLSWNFSRAGGAGGQNVNKVNTAVELTYLPLGLVVKCRQERSQEQNKQRALQILKAKLALMQEEQHAKTLKDLKGGQVKASWGTQRRNYVLHPYQLVKDLRTGVETSDTTGVLDGDLDQFVQAFK